MSAALVRQALEFVDPDESKTSGKRKRGSRSQAAAGQEPALEIEESENKKQSKKRTAESDSDSTRDVISKLLKLSKATVNKELSQKIVERTVSGKPVFDKIKVEKEVQKSILFPEDDLPKKKKTKKRNKF